MKAILVGSALFLMTSGAFAAEAAVDTTVDPAPQATVTTVGEQFLPLFNGVNLVGWKVRTHHGRHWSVENGELVVGPNKRDAEGGARVLCTADKYRNFEISFDFMVSAGGNSGFHFRLGDDADDGLEIQLLDDYAEKHANLKPWQYCGSLYGMAAPSERVSRPAGEWQTMVVRLVDQDLTITLNGTQIVQTNMEQYITEVPDRSESLKRREGYLGFQNYGVPTRFRNVMIRVLD